MFQTSGATTDQTWVTILKQDRTDTAEELKSDN